MSNQIIMARNPDDGNFIYVNCDTDGKLNVNLTGETIAVDNVTVSNMPNDYSTNTAVIDLTTVATAIQEKLNTRLIVKEEGRAYTSITQPAVNNSLSAGSSFVLNNSFLLNSYRGFGKDSLIYYTDTNINDTSPILIYDGENGDFFPKMLIAVLQPIRFGTESIRQASIKINVETCEKVSFYNPLGSNTLNNVCITIKSPNYNYPV